MLRNTLTLILMASFWTASARAEQRPANLEELWAIVQEQQAQIDELKRELAATRQQLQLTDQRLESAGDLVEEVAESQAREPSGSATKLGGYGELHYNAGDQQELDFHRFVLFLNHDFTDKLSFVSELEVEHALAGDGSLRNPGALLHGPGRPGFGPRGIYRPDRLVAALGEGRSRPQEPLARAGMHPLTPA